MASRLVVMGPVGPAWLIFYGVILTPSIAFPRHFFSHVHVALDVPATYDSAGNGTWEGVPIPGWHEILSSSPSCFRLLCSWISCWRCFAGSLRSGGGGAARVQVSSPAFHHAVFREIMIRRQSTRQIWDGNCVQRRTMTRPLPGALRAY